ncbi:hypothetical protein [Ectopseudomonas khazarica]|uniref:hypothetical protein n=1 Tax=Ectopseudomonas khazarica TaxID=2502979 RepID=UPI002FE39816
MLQAQPVAFSLAKKVLNKASERFELAAFDEDSAAYLSDTAASGIEDMMKILWATVDKLRTNVSSYKMGVLQHRVTACLQWWSRAGNRGRKTLISARDQLAATGVNTE